MGVKADLGRIAFGAILAFRALPAAELPMPPAPAPATIEARYAKSAVSIDGVLDDPVWADAPAHPLTLGRDRLVQDDTAAGEPVYGPPGAAAEADSLLDDEILGLAGGVRLAVAKAPVTRQTGVRERGDVRLAWDETCVYIAVVFEDSDIVAAGDADQMHHYRMGDVLEVFLWPDGQSGYWELYATPHGRKTSFWHAEPTRVRSMADCAVRDCGLRVAARCQGTLNRRQDRDASWTAEMAIPFAELLPGAEAGAAPPRCRILVARYNCGVILPWTELSMVPRLSKTDFHLCGEYAVLKLVK